jgi:hypothetical protein
MDGENFMISAHHRRFFRSRTPAFSIHAGLFTQGPPETAKPFKKEDLWRS